MLFAITSLRALKYLRLNNVTWEDNLGQIFSPDLTVVTVSDLPNLQVFECETDDIPAEFLVHLTHFAPRLTKIRLSAFGGFCGQYNIMLAEHQMLREADNDLKLFWGRHVVKCIYRDMTESCLTSCQ